MNVELRARVGYLDQDRPYIRGGACAKFWSLVVASIPHGTRSSRRGTFHVSTSILKAACAIYRVVNVRRSRLRCVSPSDPSSYCSTNLLPH